MALSAEFLKILACPKCKGELVLNENRPSLDCNSCALSYPVRDDIPVLLIDEAERLMSGKC